MAVASENSPIELSEMENVSFDITANQDLTSLLSGNTFYITVCDSYPDENNQTVINNHVETLVFGIDGKLHVTWMQDNVQQEVIMDYSISGETLTIVTPDEGTMTFSNVQQKATNLTFTDANGVETGRFFFDYATAEATLSGKNTNWLK